MAFLAALAPAIGTAFSIGKQVFDAVNKEDEFEGGRGVQNSFMEGFGSEKLGSEELADPMQGTLGSALMNPSQPPSIPFPDARNAAMGSEEPMGPPEAPAPPPAIGPAAAPPPQDSMFGFNDYMNLAGTAGTVGQNVYDRIRQANAEKEFQKGGGVRNRFSL